MSFKLLRVSGGVETLIGAVVTVQAIDGTNKFLILYPVTTRVNFKKGDFLRLSLKKDNATATYIGADPANETGAIIANTKTTISVPFELPNQ